MNKGKLYLIPSPLGDNPVGEVLPQRVLDIACSLTCFVVEEVRTARRFLSKYGLKGKIESLDFHELNEHTKPEEVKALLKLFEGQDVGLLSEAGLPAVADPGAVLVDLCHREGIEVVPLVGPSSLMLALMASGLNGQSFAFCGYIPAKTDARRNALRSLEKRSKSGNESLIIIETPYRNDQLFADMISTLAPGTRICVAADITLETQYIRTRTVAQWRKESLTIGKRPCVFIILA
ncbi:MAG: SAM-dependent methyltransferase [Bacteroidales bacterium]|nr:SAM-dependent methyltransferase [Bacteroidales bacterium]MBQ5582347.1 SAM-dependent methyltransferase [Bacteroidales bacterium]